MKKQTLNQNGFTLLELLIVIAIIGVLAGIIGISVTTARVRGRDAKRAGDIRQMITALDQYYVSFGYYPTGTASVGTDGGLLSDPASFDASFEPMIPTYVPFLPDAPAPADGSWCMT
jgi:prepilin-type N-terminal cleavage/methylation domain-containing protein